MDDINLMGERVKKRLKYCGENVTIHPLAKICKPEVVEIHDNCTIGDFVFIWGGEGVEIGKYSHLQVHTSIWGGGKATIGEYVSVGLNSVLLTAVYSHRDGKHMVDHVPENLQAQTLFGHLHIRDDVYIGANCTIMPVDIGKGAIIGAGAVVNETLSANGIYVGVPCRQIAIRPRVEVSE